MTDNKFHSLTDDLIIGLLKRDQDQVFLYTADESLNIRVKRLCSAKFRDPDQKTARDWLGKLVNSERLILADRIGCPPQAPALEQWICSAPLKTGHKGPWLK
jgi:hypothetical protein